jgi:DNA-binding phage protein
MATSKAERLAQKIADASLRLAGLKRDLDAELAARHNAGASIAQLTRETGLSRQGVYDAIKRHGR